MIYINSEKRRQNKKPRSNHWMLTRMLEVLPDTVMPNNYNVLYLHGDRHSQSQKALFPLQRSFWYLGGKWGNGGASEVHSFYSDRPGGSLSSPRAVPQSLHVTNYISHLLFCHYKVWDYFRVRSSVDAIAPCKRSDGEPQLIDAGRSRFMNTSLSQMTQASSVLDHD